MYGLLSRYYDVTYHKELLQETNCGGKNTSKPNTEISIQR